MLLTPGLDNPGCLLERGAHRSAAFPIWVEPEWKFHGLIHHSAGAIIRFLDSLFDAQRLAGQFTDRYQRAPAQFTAERWFTALVGVLGYSEESCKPAHRRESSRRWSPIWRNGCT